MGASRHFRANRMSLASSVSLTAVAAVAALLVPALPAAQAQTIGGNNSTWIFDNASGISDATLTSTGQGDAYDGAFQSLINGATVFSAANVAGQSVTGNFTATNVPGLNLRNRYYISTSLPAARLYVDLQNTTASSVSFLYSIFHNLGSDGNEVSVLTSSGDNLVTVADRWTVTDDSAFTTQSGDPALSFLFFGLGAAVTPSGTPAVPGPGSGVIRYDFNVTVGANQTVGLFFAGRLDNTAQNAADAIVTMDDWSEIAGTDLVTGLSSNDIAAIRNFNTNITSTAAPEPGSLALLGTMLVPMAAVVRRRRTEKA